MIFVVLPDGKGEKRTGVSDLSAKARPVGGAGNSRRRGGCGGVVSGGAGVDWAGLAVAMGRC